MEKGLDEGSRRVSTKEAQVKRLGSTFRKEDGTQEVKWTEE